VSRRARIHFTFPERSIVPLKVLISNRVLATVVAFVAMLTLGVSTSAPAPLATTTWVDSWGASFLPTLVNGTVQGTPTFKNQTLRLIVNTKLGGTGARVKLTNTFSAATLHIGAAHIALRSSGGTIAAGSDRALTFGGAASATVAPGAELWSDPVTLTIGQHVDVAISVYLPDAQFKPTNFHPTGLHTSYLSRTGNFVSSSTMPGPSFGQTSTTTQVLIAAGLQVMAPSTSRVIVALGDSITDGACASNNGNADWPSVLSKRLPALADGTPVSVINMGIGSNRLESSSNAGPPGVARLQADVLDRPNVKDLIVLEGINDISYEHATSAALIAAYTDIITRAHAAGIKVFGGTLLPIGNSVKYSAANEATRQAVNTWIRSSGSGYDGVFDFEALMAQPGSSPMRIQSGLQCGDYVHPNTSGYAKMANSIDLSLL
jgi:lysophospholipase L1-like esterase